jgi:transketolase
VADTLRFLAVDAAEKAGSGHPGAPMGTADFEFVLWDRFLKFDSGRPDWPDRDRFVLSAGHTCLVLYGLLHLYGFDLSLEDLKQYRQWQSRTPGHPEYGHTPGVETTTGPLGQGMGNAVGMALAERLLSARFNRPGFPVVDHFTYCHCSDGDLMEGVAAEAASLAGHLKLGKLIAIYDDNGITIGGSTAVSFTEDAAARFSAYGWHVERVDGHDHDAVARAIASAQSESARPSLILARTHIGYGSPGKQDTPDVHGSPLGAEETRRTRSHLGWPAEPAFFVPPEVYEHTRTTAAKGRAAGDAWRQLFEAYRSEHPDLAAEFVRVHERKLPPGWRSGLPVFPADGSKVATRSASGKVLNALAAQIPELVGGSADLEPSNKTWLKDVPAQSALQPEGRNIHFGVREHGMGAVCNGMAYHGGVLPYEATFLVFSDYQRPSVRLAALARLRVVFVYTHDSVGVGGDGPTHQPIEHLWALRVIPGLTVIRPADANETRAAWEAAVENDGPTALILTRQDVPVIAGLDAQQLRRGAYVAFDPPGRDLEAVIVATGSEVAPALEAAARMLAAGIGVRVVSMPSIELFERQDESYRDFVLPPGVDVRLVVEAGSTAGWWKYAGSGGDVLGLDRFGASAPGSRLLQEFGFTAESVASRLNALLARHRAAR